MTASGSTVPHEQVGSKERKSRLVENAIQYMWRHGSPIHATKQAEGPIATSGQGVYIKDIDGETYLDALAGGSAAATLGYGREDIAEAVADQMKRLHYSSIRTFLNEPAIELAARIADVTPGDLKTSFFGSSGSEAVETAAQIVKAYHLQKGHPEKTKFLYRTTGFHGVSLVAASASSSPDYRDWFQPLAPGFVEVPNCYTYRRPQGQDVVEYGLECAQAIEDKILAQGPETVAAIFAESIPAGLIIPPAPGYLKRLREICDRYDVLWLDDEVFIGFGRTGRYLGSEHYDVVPDIATASKGITGGYIPLGAAIVSERVMDVLIGDGGSGQAKVHGHTYSGHAAACAAGLAVLDAIEKEHLLENVERQGERMMEEFSSFATNHPHVGDVRGKGFLVGIELVKDKNSKEPFPLEWGVGKRVVKAAADRRLLVRSARDVVKQSADLVAGDLITLFPAFVASDEEVDEIVSKTKEAIDEACNNLPA